LQFGDCKIYEEIYKLAAIIYEGKDRHLLSRHETRLVKLLEESGYLTLKTALSGIDGFVGHATIVYQLELI